MDGSVIIIDPVAPPPKAKDISLTTPVVAVASMVLAVLEYTGNLVAPKATPAQSRIVRVRNSFRMISS